MNCCPLHIGVLDALNNSYGIATLWIALAFVASIVSVRMGLSVALVEILMGVLGGNLFGMSSNQWMFYEHPLYTRAALGAQHEAQLAHVPGRSWAKTVVCWADDEPLLVVVPAPRLTRSRSADS